MFTEKFIFFKLNLTTIEAVCRRFNILLFFFFYAISLCFFNKIFYVIICVHIMLRRKLPSPNNNFKFWWKWMKRTVTPAVVFWNFFLARARSDLMEEKSPSPAQPRCKWLSTRPEPGSFKKTIDQQNVRGTGPQSFWKGSSIIRW